MRFTDPPCPTCEHRSTGTKRYADDSNGMGRTYDPPPADCACGCHDAWRFMHRTPAATKGAAA
jgi:hypothetical protein